MTIENKSLPFQGMSDHDAFQLEPPFAANVRNVRSLRERIIRSPGGTLLCPQPTPGGTNNGSGTSVGTFVKTTTTGNQVVPHGLGVTPSAIMVFASGATSLATIENGVFHTIGFTDGTTSRAVAQASTNGSAGGFRSVQNGFVVFVKASDGTNSARAAFVSWDASSFTINWTVNDTQAREVHFIAIGGTGVHGKVLQWQQQAGLTGDQAVTGVGFKPQVVLHCNYGANPSAVPSAGLTINLGAMDDHGNQWSIATQTGGGIGITKSWSILATDLCEADIGQSEPFLYSSRASYVSMDADGFTVNQKQPNNFAIVSLCLNGLSGYKAGTFTRPTTAPTRLAVTGTAFMPQGVLFCSPGQQDGVAGSMGLGAGDGINSAYCNYYSAIPSNRRRMLARTDNVTGDLTPGATETALASLVSFDSDGFTLNYNVTNSFAGTIAYLALMPVGTNQALQIGIPRNYPEVYVNPSGPAVQRYVMLTHKSAFNYTSVTPSTGIFASTSENYTGNQYQRFSIANTQGIAAWSQGVDNIRQWDGTSYSDLVTSGTNHAARAVLAFNERIVSVRPYYGGADHPTQIRWSINGNVNDWNGVGSGTLEIIDTSQDPLITGFVLADRCFLAKRREIIELVATGTLTPVFGTVPRIRGMGVLAPHSVGLAEQVAFWLGPDDIYMFDGSTLTAIGERIYNTVTSLIDYQNLDTIQGAVYTPDSQYHLVVPPYKFVYDYRRDIWDWDDVYDFQAIGVYNVGSSANFTADIDKSLFIVVGDSLAQTTRVDFQATSWLGAPIDSYFETRDYTADDISQAQGILGRFNVSLWGMNSLREVRFQGPPGNVVEVGISVDRGVTYQTTNVTINQFGVGVAWFQKAFSMIRFRFRDYGTDDYEIRGSWGFDVEPSGANLP